MSQVNNPDRDSIRAAVFGIKQRTKIVVVAGVKVELRQPCVADILVNSDEGTERRQTIVRMLVDYCFVPGTDIKVFEREDAEAILAIPFGKDWQELNSAINELSDLGSAVAGAKGNSEATPAA